MGYHKAEIPKGVYGKSSKILEEVRELQDAEEQQNAIMALVELADIVGAIKGYLVRCYPDFSMEDLEQMADATSNAFADGSRK